MPAYTCAFRRTAVDKATGLKSWMGVTMKINGARVVHAVLALYALAACLPIGLGQSVGQLSSKLSRLPGSSSLVENRLFVKMFDYVRLSKPTRLQVEQVTGGIFARAGVNLIWIDRTVGEKLQQGPRV